MKNYLLLVTMTLLLGVGANFFLRSNPFPALLLSHVTGRASCTQKFPIFNPVGSDEWRLDFVINIPEFVINDDQSIDGIQKCLQSLNQSQKIHTNRCLGIFHATGIGRGKSIDSAIDYLDGAAKLGDTWSGRKALHLKIRHHFMNAGNQNSDKYIKNIKEICEGSNDIVALRIVADGYFAQGNNENGAKCLGRLLTLDDPYELCMNGKRLYENADREKFANEILASWKTSAFNGNFASSYSNLGLLSEEGLAVPKDYLEAMRMYIEAEKRHSVAGIRNQASLLEQGFLEEPDYVRIQSLYQKAANDGDLFSLRKLGYRDGRKD